MIIKAGDIKKCTVCRHNLLRGIMILRHKKWYCNECYGTKREFKRCAVCHNNSKKKNMVWSHRRWHCEKCYGGTL